MKRLLLPLLASFLFIASCDKDKANCATKGTTANATEVDQLRQYIQSHGISAVEDSRGFFYTMINQGTDPRPDLCSGCVVNYTGQLINGNTFDQGQNVKFTLANLIAGWQEGIPLIGESGKIILYLPPSLGYGAQAQQGIPANSITVFTIELLDVQ